MIDYIARLRECVHKTTEISYNLLPQNFTATYVAMCICLRMLHYHYFVWSLSQHAAIKILREQPIGNFKVYSPRFSTSYS